MIKRVIGLSVLSLLVACGDSSNSSSGGGGGGGTSVACTFAAQGTCGTLTAPSITAAQRTALQAECAADGGTLTDGACSTTNAVSGACTATDPTDLTSVAVTGMSIKITYYTSQYNAATAQADCAGFGTWSGGGGGGGPTTISCTWAGDACIQLTGTISAAQSTQLQTICAGDGGTYATAACSTAGAVAGSCYYADGNDVSPVTIAGITGRSYYYTAGWTLAEAQADCAAPPPGVWQ